MKRNLGSMTGLLAILAIALHTAFPTTQESGGTTSAVMEKKSGAKKDGAGGNPDEPPEGPWLATRAYFRDFKTAKKDGVNLDVLFSLEKPVKKSTAKDLRDLFAVPDEAQIYSIVATVPDPLHTRLALLFDETIDAIERAAEHQGWVFSNQWLPWLDPANGSEDDISERRHQRGLLRQQEALPGILVFRNNLSEAVLLVFLVPESPTGGIAGDSFSTALNLANILPPPDGPMNEIGLLAPGFSGSFPSLTRLLNQWIAVKRDGPKLHEEIFGGRVSSFTSAQTFAYSLNANRKHNFQFHSGIVSSEQYRQVFECRVLPRYDVDRGQAAYLIEQETGFGEGLFHYSENKDAKLEGCEGGNNPKPLAKFRFPRDIAHLRNAYREMGQATGTRNPGVLPSVDFTLKDPTRGEDSIPAFSETGSSMTQSASLDLITNELKHERIKLVHLVATNPLDMIFVTQVVRRESPDTRVMVADSPSILFIPAAGQEPLLGTLFLATYPMFFHGYEWLDTDNPALVDEPLSYEQGLTNTAQLLLTQLTHTEPDNLRGYTRFDSKPQNNEYPGLWLLTLTPAGFFPVDWFDAGNGGSWLKLYNPFRPKPRVASLEERFLVPDPTFGWYLTTWGVTITIFAVCFFLLRSNLGEPRPLWLALTDNYRARIPSLVGASLSLSALEWILLVPALYVDRIHGYRVTGTRIAGGLGFLAPLASTVWILIRKRAEFRGKCPRLRDVLYPGFFLLIYGLVLFLWAWSCGGLGYADAPAYLMFKTRSVQLYSGASPATPLLLLGFLFFGTFAIYFFRFTQTGKGKPRLAALSSVRMQKSYDATGDFMGGPGKLPTRELVERLMVCLTLIGVSALVVWGRIRPFERQPYHWALALTLSVLALALAAGCYDLWFTWRNFKTVLNSLKLDPLDDAFARVAKLWARRPVWAFWRSVPEESLAAQMKRALCSRIHVADEAAISAKADFDEMQDSAEARFYVVCKDPLGAIEKYQKTIANLGGKMAEIVNRDPCPVEMQEERDPLNPAQQFLNHSADFLALYYCNYIIYAAMQIQRIAWGVTLSMVMLTVVLNSYSVQDPLIVGRFVAVVFVAVATIVVAVFAGMERDPILSCIARTKAGELNAEFWFQIAAMGLLPAIGVLTHLFPSMASFLSSWVAPSLDATR